MVIDGRSHCSSREHCGSLRQVVGVFLAAAVAAAVAGGCSRCHTLNCRLNAIEDEAARRIVRDTVWAHGSKYRWAECTVLRAEVARTERRPGGDTTTDEIWLLDPVTGHLRIETPAQSAVAVFDGRRLRVFRDGAETDDPADRGRAAGQARLVGELLAMPLSLLADGRTVTYAGTRTATAEARTWQRLAVTDGTASGYSGQHRTVVEVRKGARRVENVFIRWSQDPFFGRRMRVRMDDWRPADDLVVSRRWRFTPIDESGAATGPVQYTVRIHRVEVNPEVGGRPFSRP